MIGKPISLMGRDELECLAREALRAREAGADPAASPLTAEQRARVVAFVRDAAKRFIEPNEREAVRRVADVIEGKRQGEDWWFTGMTCATEHDVP